MRKRYQSGIIQGVVIRTLDRLSRSQTHVAILLEEMEHHGVTLYCVKEKIDDTPMGKFARMVLAFVAEMEREKIMDRTLTGRENAAKNGKIVGGRKAPYNWQWILNEKGERDHIEVAQEQAENTKWMAQMYADEGWSFRQLETDLNNRGALAPSGMPGKWTAKTIRDILTDPRLIGKGEQFSQPNSRAEKHFDPVPYAEGTWPRIRDDVTFAKILKRIELNKIDQPRKSKKPDDFLLRNGYLRGDTRASVRHSLNAANEMLAQFEAERAKAALGMIELERKKVAFQEILERCKMAKEARGGIELSEKERFLRLARYACL